MTTVYVVVYPVGGFAREDADRPDCGGVYTKEEDAKIHAKVIRGTVVPVEVDYMSPGIIANAKELGIIPKSDIPRGMW